MTFGQPLWFWALAILPLLFLLFLNSERRRVKLISQLVAARLHDRLAGSVSAGKRRLRFFLILAGLACVIAALAQPRAGYDWMQTKRKGRDVLIAIDTSRSMLATDLAPDRLTRAKLAAQDLISQLGGDRAGLIAFAGNAFLQAPLTVDYSAVLGALGEVDTEIIQEGGTNIGAALKIAEDAFGKGESDHRALVIFTDGEDLEDEGVKAAENLKGSITIFTVGLGSPEGSLIPLPGGRGGEFVKDLDGQIVKSRLDEERLSKIADLTGGFYLRLDNGAADAGRIVRDGLGKMTEHDIDSKLSRQPIERYEWPLAAGIVLLIASMLIGERRRNAPLPRMATAAAISLAAFLLLPLDASAKNAGLEAYEREDYQGSLDTFSRQLKLQPKSEALHFNMGCAEYKKGDMDKALESFSRAITSSDPQLRAKAEYNLGNTLYQRGVKQKEKEPKIQEWENAIQHYEETLKAQANNKDAQFNRDLIKKLIADLKKEPPKEDKKDQKQDDKDKKDENQDQKDQKDGNKGDKQDQKDSKNGQDSKDQKGDPKDSKDGQESKDQNGDQKDPKDQDGKDGKPQDKPGKEGDKKDDTQQQQQPDQNGKGDKEGDKQNAPQPGDPAEDKGKKPEGELKSGAQGGQDEPSEAEQQAAEEMAAAAEGKMTEKQASNLLESLKSEDRRMQLNPRSRTSPAIPRKNW